MNPTFISKYKPYLLADFCIDENFTQVLRTLIELDHLNLLLVGSPSSGKTSLLYSLIREYYGLAKDAPLPENNLLFVNNIKEQGIQYFRNEMKTFCQSSSAIYGKKKLVIIDDIDTVNEQSQQVFRNYIDKFKHNIHFISVCTNIQKVIESYQSRVHIIQIPPTTDTQVRRVMETIIASEQLQMSDEAKDHLLVVSTGSIRVLINYLEKIVILYSGDKGDSTNSISTKSISTNSISLVQCKTICSNISFHQFETYIECLKRGDLSAAIHTLYSIYDYGYSVIDILDFFFIFLKSTTLLSESTKYTIIPYICKYITVFHNIHEDNIELALFTNNLIAMELN